MSGRNKRIDGGAYRRAKTLVRLNCKPGKDRSGAYTRHSRKRKKR